MAIESIADVHVDQVLSNLILDYGRADLLANAILPVIVVANDTGKYYEWARNSINITGISTLRDDRAIAHEVNIDVTLRDYKMEQHALREFLPDTIRKNADSILTIQRRYAEHVMDMMDLIKEKETADVVFNPATYPATNKTTLVGNFRWNQIGQVSSDPKGDIAMGQRAVLLEAGVWPQTLLTGFDLHQKLKRHVNILASIQYVQRTGINFISDSEIMDYLGITKMYVGKAVYNTQPEGLEPVADFVWNTHALLFYEAPAGGAINKPAFGYEFRPSHTPRTVSRYRPDDMLGEFVEVNEKRFMKITFPKAGFLFIDADAA